MLKLVNVNVYYGAIHALKDINIEINDGEIVTLIGSNGAGKTTTLRAISGFSPPKSGDIIYRECSLKDKLPHSLIGMGLSHVPEGRRIFANLTVLENLELGAYTCKDKSLIKENMNKVFDRLPRLKERLKQSAGTLSGGEQQMLAIGRALMVKPEMLLLDEPSMGLSPILINEIFNIIKEINQLGTTILLVEQNAKMALSIANRAYVLETGKVVHQGSSEELLNDEKVRSAYLG